MLTGRWVQRDGISKSELDFFLSFCSFICFCSSLLGLTVLTMSPKANSCGEIRHLLHLNGRRMPTLHTGFQKKKDKRNKNSFLSFFSFKAIICITCMQTWLLWTNFVKHEASMCFICVLTVAKLVLQIIWLLRFCWPRISTTESRWERRQSSSICSICLKLVNSWKENFNSFPDVFLSFVTKKRHFCFTNQQQQALSWVFTQPFSHLFQTRIECHFDHRWSSAVSFVRKKKFVFFLLSLKFFPGLKVLWLKSE